MFRRCFWLMPLGLVGLLICCAPAFADDKADTVKSKAEKQSNQLLTAEELADFIDQHIAEKWVKHKVTPAPTASDAEFLRRLHLDLAGRIPKVADTRAFLTNKSDNKRAALINKLLDNPQYVAHFTNTWRNVILPQKNSPQSNIYRRNFSVWLVKQVRDNAAFDKMVYEILTAGLNTQKAGQPYNYYNNGPYAFYQANSLKPEDVAAATSRIFLGVRLECAQCHNHPFAEWSKDQFWQFAAFFSSVKRPAFVPGKPAQPVPVNLKTIKIPETDKTVSATFLDGNEPDWQKESDPRTTLAKWVTSPENPYFTRTTVNRMWAHFFGVGIIDPVDDEPTKENPPSHPELLKLLQEQFIAHKYDVKYLIRAITLSKTYQLTSSQTHKSQKEPQLFARMAVRGVTPEQLFDSLVVATGYQEPGSSSNALLNFYNTNSVRGKFLAAFESTDAPTVSQTSILQALKLMNGEFIVDATSIGKSQTLTAVAEAPFFSTEDRITTLYLATLTRYPRADELKRLTEYVNGGGPRKDQNAALADVYWALLNCSEFMLNH